MYLCDSFCLFCTDNYDVIITMGSGLMLIFADHAHNICKTCVIQMHDFRKVRQYLSDEAAILAANAVVGRCLVYCKSLFRSLSSFNMHKPHIVKTPLIGLSQTLIDTHGHLLFSNKSIGCQSNFLKTATLVYKFLQTD